MSLEVQKQKAKNDWLFWRINCTKQMKCIKSGPANIFRVIKAPTKLWLMFLEIKRHQESYDRQFYKL